MTQKLLEQLTQLEASLDYPETDAVYAAELFQDIVEVLPSKEMVVTMYNSNPQAFQQQYGINCSEYLELLQRVQAIAEKAQIRAQSN